MTSRKPDFMNSEPVSQSEFLKKVVRSTDFIKLIVLCSKATVSIFPRLLDNSLINLSVKCQQMEDFSEEKDLFMKGDSEILS